MIMAKILGIAPVLLVRDILRSADYYREKLGFDVELYGDPPNFCIAQRDAIRIMLAKADDGVHDKLLPHWKIVEKMWNAYFWVDDADALYEEFQKSGAIIDYTIYNTPWGTREFGIQDVDEHDIAFGQKL